MSIRNIKRYSSRDLALNLMFTAFLFHFFLWNHIRGTRRRKSSISSKKFSSEVIKKEKNIFLE